MFENVWRAGMDVHRRFSILGLRDAKGKWLGQVRVEHQDRRRMRAALQQLPPGTPIVVEGSYGWPWICDELPGCGLDPHLCSTFKVAKWREAQGHAKSNRIDARVLSGLWWQSEPWWEVWLPPPPVRDEREWMRYRTSLVRVQTQTKCRIHALLQRHGIPYEFSDLFGGVGVKFLQALSASPAELPESSRAVLAGYLGLLIHLRGQIAQVTRSLRQRLGDDPVVRRLRSIPGIGWILAHVMVAEVGVIERFRNAKHLVSYSLLAPRSHDSGDDDPQNPIGRHVGFIGRRTLKWTFIEAAHAAVRQSPRYAGIFARRTNGGKRDCNRGYIAVAGELCRTADLLWRKQMVYQETPSPGAGAADRRRGPIPPSRVTRPGTSQPERPMVAVS